MDLTVWYSYWSSIDNSFPSLTSLCEDGFGGDLQVKLSGISTVVRRGGAAEPPLFFPFFPERLAGGCSGGVIHIHVVHRC